MCRARLLSLTLIFATALPTTSAGQERPEGPPILSVEGIELTVGGRLQTLFSTTDVPGVPASEFFLRRARLEVSLQVNEQVSGTLQPEFGGGEVSMKDAYLNLAVSPGLQVLAGKAYRPFGLIEQTSSKRILPIERGLRIEGLAAADEYALLSSLQYTNRDVGIQVYGEPEGAPLGLAYEVGVLAGPLNGQIDDEHSYQFAGRVTVQPIERTRLGAGWSRRDFASFTGGSTEMEAGNAFEVDLEYGAFAPGVHVLAEVSRGDLDPFEDLTFWGAHVWLAYRTEQIGPLDTFIEPLLRVSHSDVETLVAGTPGMGGTLFTPGINFYFTPLNRVAVNYDIWRGQDGGRDAKSFKAMFQFAF